MPTTEMSAQNFSHALPVAHNETANFQSFSIFVAINFTILGLLGALGSAFVAVVIFASKALSSPCYQLIAATAVGSSLSAVYFFLRGINQIGIMLGTFNLYRLNWICLTPAVLFGFWGPPFQCLTSCAIACDRMVSMLKPIRYPEITNRHAIGVILACAVLVTIDDVGGLFVTPLHTNVMCRGFSDNFNRGFKVFFAAMMLSLFALTVLLYLPLIICFRLRWKSYRDPTNASESQFRQQQLAMMPAIRLMMILYLTTGVIGESLINVARQLEPDPIATVFRGSGSLLKALGCLVEIFALVVRSGRFRECCRDVLRCKKTTTTVTSVTTR